MTETERDELLLRVLERQDQLEARLIALQASINRLAPPSRLSESDLGCVRALLPIAVGAFGNGVAFRTRQLHELPACRVLFHNRSPKAVGKLLHRASTAGIVDGCIVSGAGEERGYALWSVTQLVLTSLTSEVKAA